MNAPSALTEPAMLSLVSAATETPDPEALCRAAIAGENWATDALWQRHYARVRGLLMRMLGPSDEIDDVTQEVFERFFRKLGEVRELDAHQSFLVGITIRVAKQELARRRVKRWLRLTAAGELPESAFASDDPEARAALRRLYAVLEKLGPEPRTLFVLRYVEELELQELARALGESLATVKRKLRRAVQLVHAACRRDAALLAYLEGRDDP